MICNPHLDAFALGKITKGKVLVELGKNHIRGSDKVNQKKSIFLGFMKWEY